MYTWLLRGRILSKTLPAQASANTFITLAHSKYKESCWKFAVVLLHLGLTCLQERHMQYGENGRVLCALYIVETVFSVKCVMVRWDFQSYEFDMEVCMFGCFLMTFDCFYYENMQTLESKLWQSKPVKASVVLVKSKGDNPNCCCSILFDWYVRVKMICFWKEDEKYMHLS